MAWRCYSAASSPSGLILNITNLLYAVYFMMGRKAYRASERFEADIPVRLTYNGKPFAAVTKNISEGGFLFRLEHPTYLPGRRSTGLHVKERELLRGCEGAHRLYQQRRQPVALSRETRTRSERREPQVVSPSSFTTGPHSLPKSMNIWVTAFDDIVNNASLRLEKQHSEMRALPRIQLERFVRFEEGVSGTLIDFNFKYVLIRALSEKADKLTLVPRTGIRIDLQNTNKPLTTPGVTLYAVTNWEELAGSRAFQTLLEDWIFEYNQGVKRPRRSRKKSVA